MSKYFRNFDHYDYDFPSVNSYESAERLYNNITPIKGPRKHLDLRPLGRRRTGTSYVKKMDGAYRIWSTFTVSPWSLRRTDNSGYDYSNYDTSVDYYKDKIVINIGRTLVESLALLAACVSLVRYNSKLYIETSKGLFLLPKNTEITLKKKEGEWQVVNPVREHILKISPATKKKITKELKDWFLWAKKMWPFIETAPSHTYSRTYFRMGGVAKDITYLKNCKENAIDRQWDYGLRGHTVTPWSFEKFRKKGWRQARIAMYKAAKLTPVTVPLGTPAPRQEF